MKNKTVLVVGSGQGPTVAELALKMAGETKAEVVELQSLLDQRSCFPTDKPIEYKPAPQPYQPEENRHTCKGKHQYRENRETVTEGEGGTVIKSTWVCQCGRNIND